MNIRCLECHAVVDVAEDGETPCSACKAIIPETAIEAAIKEARDSQGQLEVIIEAMQGAVVESIMTGGDPEIVAVAAGSILNLVDHLVMRRLTDVDARLAHLARVVLKPKPKSKAKTRKKVTAK